MEITINGATAASLSISSVTIREVSLGGAVAQMDVEADAYDENAGLAHGAVVTIALGGQQLFKGKVKRTPRSADGGSEGYGYEVRDAWDDLARLPFQEERIYKNTDGEDESAYIGEVTWEATVSLGQRIAQVISYAVGSGVDLAVGSIDAGIPWYRTSYKDRTCGEVLLDMMRLMPGHVLWIDNRQATPVMHMRAQANLPVLSYDINAGDVIFSNDITSLEEETVSQVILRYEKPIQSGDSNYTQIIQDAAPPGADGRALGAMVESIPIRGLSAQFEYAPVTASAIPQVGAEQEDIVSWWIDHTPSLAALAGAFSKAEVAAKLTVATADVAAENIFKHTLKVVDDGIPRPEPIVSGATPIEQTTDVSDYPNELIEGTLPYWAGRRYRTVSAVASLAISGATAEADGDLEKALLEIFTAAKTFGGNDYLTANFNGSVTGTNASTKNYSRMVSYDGGEAPPTGIAAALLAELSKIRYTGSLVLVGADADTAPRIGRSINLTGGRAEWAGMKEIIQQVEYDLNDGTASISFGPPEQLGATDMVERLRAARRNTFSPPSPSAANDGVGGTAATPSSNFTVVSPPLASVSVALPWRISTRNAEGFLAKVGVEGSVIFDPFSNTISAIAITNLGEDIALDDGVNYIVLEAAITATSTAITPTSFTLLKSSTAPPIFTEASGLQTKASRLIGRVTITDGVATVDQFTSSALKLEKEFNGALLLVLEPY